MKAKTKSSVLRLCLDVVILLIVTVGTTVVFRRAIGFEVDLSSDLIFFLGVFIIGKILIAALLNLTEFGKNFFVAAVGIGVADAIIILINSLMHFGISTRLLFFILILDVVLIAVAHIIMGVMERQSMQKRQQSEWLVTDKKATARDDEAMTDIYETIADGENANPALQSTATAAVKVPQRPYSWEPEETLEEDDNVAFTGLDGIEFHGKSSRQQGEDDMTSTAETTPEQDSVSPEQPVAADDEDQVSANGAAAFDKHPLDDKSLSDHVKDDANAVENESNNHPDIAAEGQHSAENATLEADDVVNKQSELSGISDGKTQNDKDQHVYEVLPFDKTEALPHIETPKDEEATTNPEKPVTPKTVKASYSRDTQDHLAIGPEEIVLENNNAEIIIHEDDLALIRQYMKLQRSAKA